MVALGVTAAIVVGFAVYIAGRPTQAHPASRPGSLPGGSFIGLYTHDSPVSYAGVTAFTSATDVKPNVVVYYSGWLEPFQSSFAATATRAGAVPLVQINPTNASVAAVAAGQYDNYLDNYARAVRVFGAPVILSFGHEMNGDWYTWGYKHTSPAVFIAAWRHIVTLFRAQNVRNVTWVWTINTIAKNSSVSSPGRWWPGKSYVNWVGIDGYYTTPSAMFSSVFGPTIVNVRTITRDPILITETSVTPATTQPAKISDLFAGIRLYGLLGFIWFDSADKVDWRLSTAAAIAAFRQEAKKYAGDQS